MLQGLVGWVRARSFWQKVGLIVLLAFVALSVWNGVRQSGGTQLVSGTLVGPGSMELVRGRLDGGLLYVAFQGGQTDGVEIDAMPADGSKGTITVFGRARRAYADLATCDAGFRVAPDGAVSGTIDCPDARTTDGGGQHTSISVTFTARPATPAAASGG